MVIAAFIASAVVTGSLLALFARTQGVHQTGILVALGVIGGGIQMLGLITWYLRHTGEKARQLRSGQRSDLQEPSVDRIDER